LRRGAQETELCLAKKPKPAKASPTAKSKQPARRAKRRPVDRRAWSLAGLSRGVSIKSYERYASIESDHAPAIHVYDDYTLFLKATRAERELAASHGLEPDAAEALRVPAGHKLERGLAYDRVVSQAGPARKPGSTVTRSKKLARHQARLRAAAEERDAAARHAKAASEALLAASPILKEAGIDFVHAGNTLVFLDRTFRVRPSDGRGTVKMESPFVPAIRFEGLTYVFERATRDELQLVRPPAHAHGREVHAPLGSGVDSALLLQRAKRAVAAKNGTLARAAREHEKEAKQKAQLLATQAAQSQQLMEMLPKLLEKLAGQLSLPGESYRSEDGKLYLEDVRVATLDALRIRIYGQPPITISPKGIVPEGLKSTEQKALHAAPSREEKRAAVLNLIRLRLRAARTTALADIAYAKQLLFDSGVHAVQTPDGLAVDGQLEVSFCTRPDLDRLVARHCRGLLQASIESRLAHLLLPVSLSIDASGNVALSHGGTRIAAVRRSKAWGRSEGEDWSVSGNFLVEGPHWVELAQRLHVITRPAEEALVQSTPAFDSSPSATPALLVVREPPAGLPRGVVEQCLEASNSIRTRRNAAFSQPVTLSTVGRTVVTFFPVQSLGDGAVAPIVFDYGEAKVICDLLLNGDHDPLTLLIRTEVRDPAGVWALSLLGFATLTVLPEPELAAPANPRPHATHGRRPRASAPARLRAPSRVRYLSRDLEPTGITRTAHWVLGHVRVLPEGSTHSPGAREEAKKLGITLAPQQTWVRPHARGLLPNQALTFKWKLSHELLALVP
jgi:hypothetical protein